MAKSNLHRATGARTATADGEFARRFIEVCFDDEFSIIDDVMEPAADPATASQDEPARYDHYTARDSDRLKAYFRAMQTAFPDLSVTVQDTAVDGDEVAVWWIAQATHEDRIGRFEPTGRPVKLQGATICTITDGTVEAVESRWNLWMF